MRIRRARNRNSAIEPAAPGSRALRAARERAIECACFSLPLSFLRRGFAEVRSARPAVRLLIVRLDPVLADLAIERGEADPEAAGRLLLVELGLGKDGEDVLALEAARHVAQHV